MTTDEFRRMHDALRAPYDRAVSRWKSDYPRGTELNQKRAEREFEKYNAAASALFELRCRNWE